MADEESAEEPSRHIPSPLRRLVMVEAGHRCAIPTCRGTAALEVHHIVDWAKVKEHTFDNLIVLCAVCHHRATTGEIDRLAMLQYKANLALISDRYGDLERRCLEWAMVTNMRRGDFIDLPGGLHLQMWYALKDGLFTRSVSPNNMVTTSGPTGEVHVALEAYALTYTGANFLARWRDARAIDG